MTTGLGRGKTLDSTQLGGVIRNRRLATNLTLARLSAQTGLSQSFLSQLENGRTNTSLRSLQVIADALDTTATVLLANADTDSRPVARADDDMLTISDEPGARVRSLVRGKRQLRALEFIGEAHDDRAFIHDHDEVLYVVSGSVSAALGEIDDEQAQTLTVGDALYVDARVRHRWRALSADTRVIIVGVADDMTVRRASRKKTD